MRSLPTVKRETFEEQVYGILRSEILSGRVRGGTRLVQENLAQELGTSRMPVRDALKRLHADGLVSVDDHGGYRVTLFGPDDARELYDLRALLEAHAAGIALDQMTSRRLGELRSIVDNMESAADARDIDTYTRLNAHFHMLLYETSGHGKLLRMIEGLWQGPSPLTPISITGQLERSREEHLMMLAAMESSDAEALRMVIRRHITHARDALIEHLEREEADAEGSNGSTRGTLSS